MIRATILTVALLAIPGVASAHCGGTQGSFAVTCETGVTVYRHKAPFMIPAGPTSAQTQLEIAKLRQQTALARIAADRQTQSENSDLRRQEIAQEEYRNRVYQARSARRNRGYGVGYGGYYGGYTLARPLTVRTKH